MVERFQMKHEHDWICARQDDKGDWVRHSDHLAIIGRIEDDRTDERVQWMGELSALKKQVEELTAERDAIYRAAMDIFDETSMFLITEAQAKRSVAATMNRARAALASTRETSDA